MSHSTPLPRSIGAAQLQSLAARLDAMDPEQRLAFVRATTGATQAKLWAASAGRGVALGDLVPEEYPAATEVIHFGKNSLPLFSHFEKRFCRVEGHPDRVYGYNEGALRPWIGPGYFVAHALPGRDGVSVDYRQIPPTTLRLPEGWPALQANETGLQRFVFAGMVDHLRRVSSHVIVGRAEKGGKATNNYFLLCRSEL